MRRVISFTQTLVLLCDWMAVFLQQSIYFLPARLPLPLSASASAMSRATLAPRYPRHLGAPQPQRVVAAVKNCRRVRGGRGCYNGGALE